MDEENNTQKDRNIDHFVFQRCMADHHLPSGCPLFLRRIGVHVSQMNVTADLWLVEMFVNVWCARQR